MLMLIVASQIDLSDLTPGDYDLNVSVYDWKTGARLMGLDERSEARGDMLRIDTFEIQPPGP